jgi:hypothetical protein
MPIVQLRSKQPGPFKDTQYFEFKDTQYISFYSAGPALITLNIDPVILTRIVGLDSTSLSITLNIDPVILTRTTGINSDIISTLTLLVL